VSSRRYQLGGIVGKNFKKRGFDKERFDRAKINWPSKRERQRRILDRKLTDCLFSSQVCVRAIFLIISTINCSILFNAFRSDDL